MVYIKHNLGLKNNQKPTYRLLVIPIRLHSRLDKSHSCILKKNQSDKQKPTVLVPMKVQFLDPLKKQPQWAEEKLTKLKLQISVGSWETCVVSVKMAGIETWYEPRVSHFSKNIRFSIFLFNLMGKTSDFFFLILKTGRPMTGNFNAMMSILILQKVETYLCIGYWTRKFRILWFWLSETANLLNWCEFWI